MPRWRPPARWYCRSCARASSRSVSLPSSALPASVRLTCHSSQSSAYLVVVLLFIGDIPTLAASPTGFPFLQVSLLPPSLRFPQEILTSGPQIMYDCVNNEAGAIFLSFATTAMAMLAVPSLICSTSRTLFAFARDGGVPFSRTFAKIHPTLDVPVNAVLLTTALMASPGIIYIGNATVSSPQSRGSSLRSAG